MIQGESVYCVYCQSFEKNKGDSFYSSYCEKCYTNCFNGKEVGKPTRFRIRGGQKSAKAISSNGRAAFFACIFDDIREALKECGWAAALHGSLASDMDIMAMPWTNDASTFEEAIGKVSTLFKDNELSKQYKITYNEKPHNRIVATIPIWDDFYLDISSIRRTPEYANYVLELICAAINDCDSNNMTATSETLRGVLNLLEKIFDANKEGE